MLTVARLVVEVWRRLINTEDFIVKFRVSNVSERLVGKLDAGEDLVEVLTRICEEHGVTAGDIRAVGHFETIKLVHFNAKKQSYETLVDGDGSFDLVSLDGNVSRLGDEIALRLAAVFNVTGPVGPQMVGGQLLKARALSGEFVIDSFVDLNMERRLEPESGRLVLDNISRRAGAPKEPQRELATTPVGEATSASPAAASEGAESLSWDEAIAEVGDRETNRKNRRQKKGSARRTKGESKKKSSDPYEDLDLDEPLVSAGDLIDHPKLGRCRVLDVEDDQYIRIRLPRGRIRKLALEVLEIEYQGKEDGKALFDARVRR